MPDIILVICRLLIISSCFSPPLYWRNSRMNIMMLFLSEIFSCLHALTSYAFFLHFRVMDFLDTASPSLSPTISTFTPFFIFSGWELVASPHYEWWAIGIIGRLCASHRRFLGQAVFYKPLPCTRLGSATLEKDAQSPRWDTWPFLLPWVWDKWPLAQGPLCQWSFPPVALTLPHHYRVNKLGLGWDDLHMSCEWWLIA